MSYHVSIQPLAADELDFATRWIARSSTSRATTWFAGISAAIQTLTELPRRCPLAPENDVFAEEIRQLLYGDYRILFTVKDDTVLVLHVRRGARRSLNPEEQM